jgi:hypothetical protein
MATNNGAAGTAVGQVQVSAAQIAACLTALTQPDTASIRQAELELKPILKQPESMMLLWQIICQVSDDSTQVAIRHVACIVLRKRLPAHYSTLDASTKTAWQQQVLQQTAIETIRPVQTALVAVAASLQQVDQAATPAVLQFVSAAVNNPNPAAQELCFLLLSEMTDTVGLHWKEHLPALQQLFSATLTNAQTPVAVQKSAVSALGQLMSFWADDVEIEGLAPLLPVLLQVAALLHQDEDFLAVVLDVLYDLAYSPAAALQPHMHLSVEFALQCLQNRDLELRIRDAAALVIATTAEAKPKTFGRSVELMGRVLDTLFQLMQESPESAAGALFESNPAWRADLEDDMDAANDIDLDSPTETSMAQGTLDMIACEVPKKYVWQPCLERCLRLMSDAQNPAARKAGVAGLGVIAEGCCEPLRECLAQVIPYVFSAAQDPSPQVRECACFCLGQISEHIQPDILQYSRQILPIVFALLDDDSVAVQATSCYVLEMFCERLEPDAVRPLLDQLVRKLAAMLEATTKRSVQEMAVAALAATAVAAEEEFTPYVAGVATLMIKLMQLQDVNLYSLRGRALECMGHMAIAVGRDTFRPYFPAVMQSAMEGLATESTDLQEFAYAVFANLAKVMKEEFAPALPDLVPHLVKVIEMDEGQLEERSEDGSGDGGGGGGGNNLSGLDDSDDEDNEGNYVLHVRTALLEVKKGAITALGEMAAHTGTNFCPHLEECMQVLQKAAGNWHPLVKCEVADAFPSLIIPSIAAYHNGEIEWKKGDLSGPNPLSAHTQAIVGAVMQELIALMMDDDKSTVGKACEALQSVIELCGPHAMAPMANELLSNTHALLNKTAPCQEADQMYGELPDDDDDHDVVTQAACDLVGGFGRVMGAQFAPYLPQFLPAICEYGKSSRPPSDRSMSVGCLSEIAQELEVAIADHWKSVFLPAVLAGLADADDNVKRNSAFCAGVCCEHLKDQAASDFQSILQVMGPIFSINIANENDSSAACIDNAAAAVARMIMASPTHVPLPQVLPAFLRVLPLKTDMTENDTVYACLLGLLQMNHPDMVANVPEVKRIFNEACQEGSKVDDETKHKLQQTLQTLNAQ